MTLHLADFEGAWQLDRVLDDRLAGRRGHLRGTARFVADGTGLTYTEEGTLAFPGQPPLTARQSYLWRADGAALAVHFQDKTAFHHIDLTKKNPTARHDCAPDTYLVTYDFTAWPNWSATWTVTGPRKDYVSTSRYSR